MRYLHIGINRRKESYDLPDKDLDVIVDRTGNPERWDLHEEMPIWWASLRRAVQTGDTDRSILGEAPAVAQVIEEAEEMADAVARVSAPAKKGLFKKS